MTQESKLLIGALRRAVAGTATALSTAVDWEVLVRLAQMHSVLPLVYDGLSRDQEVWAQVPAKVQELLQKAFLGAIYRDAQMTYLQTQLEDALTRNEVRHIFLKGTVLKHDYPVPALRTMSDMDILVYTEDYAVIDQVAQELGGKRGAGDGNHRNYSFPSGVAVEFHPNLLHHDTPVGTQINPGWQYARQNGKNCAMELTEEGFYLNTLCHLANHFVAGGVGVRFVLDVWVNRNLRKQQLDRAFVEQELSRFGLLEFARNIEALAQAWFGDGAMTPVLEELEVYILTSGSHGQNDRAVLNAMSFAGSRSSALLGKMFYSRQEMEDRFPWCKGKPWLLPVAWCVRAFNAVTRHGTQISRWSKESGKVSREQIRQQQEKLERLGIRTGFGKN